MRVWISLKMTILLPVQWSLRTPNSMYDMELQNIGMRIPIEDSKKLKEYLSTMNPPADWYFDDFKCKILDVIIRIINHEDFKYLNVIKYNPITREYLQSTFDQKRINIPKFLLKYITIDLSCISPYVTQFVEFEKGISLIYKYSTQNVELNVLTKIFPSLHWITECKKTTQYGYTKLFIGYNGYYIGVIRVHNDLLSKKRKYIM